MDEGFDVDQKWQSFLANEGWVISQEIYANLESTLNLFDTADGTHAKLAADGHVGVLLVFDNDEIDMLLTTYFDGMDGHEGAQMASVLAALRDGDCFLFPYYRGLSMKMMTGLTSLEAMLSFMGKQGDVVTVGAIHLTDRPVVLVPVARVPLQCLLANQQFAWS
mgnify:CR=1 FL=1